MTEEQKDTPMEDTSANVTGLRQLKLKSIDGSVVEF